MTWHHAFASDQSDLCEVRPAAAAALAHFCEAAHKLASIHTRLQRNCTFINGPLVCPMSIGSLVLQQEV